MTEYVWLGFRSERSKFRCLQIQTGSVSNIFYMVASIFRRRSISGPSPLDGQSLGACADSNIRRQSGLTGMFASRPRQKIQEDRAVISKVMIKVRGL